MDKLHYIHSRGGRIGGRADTGPQDVDAIVAALAADDRRHLVIHFHGGLVSKQAGLAIAEKLLPVYSPTPGSGGYPLFFVWESGAWETIRNNFTELADEPVFKQLLRKLMEYAFERVGGSIAGARGGGATAREQVNAELKRFWDNPSATTLPFRDVDTAPPDAVQRGPGMPINEDEIQGDLENDPEFKNAMATLPRGTAMSRDAFQQDGAIEHRSAFSEMAAEEFSEQPGARGLVSLYKIACFLARVLRGLINRYQEHRDHGLHATCVEEIIRGFKFGGSGLNEWAKALQWNRMKQDTRDAFDPDPELHAGTALLERLKRALKSGMALDRITLVGHSTGAIYIANWLKHAGNYLPDLKHDVVFLAPAINYAEFADLLAAQKARIDNFRMFAMQDALERDDQLWGGDEEVPDGKDWRRFIYPSSLLYLVSGILESAVMPDGTIVDEPDMPIVGMARFFENKAVFTDKDFPNIASVRQWLTQRTASIVWSRAVDGAAGFNCGAVDHGAFDDEELTVASLTRIVTNGFS